MQKPLLNFYWIKDRPWRLLAFGFGSGLSPYAPGTVGTLWAWVIGLGFPLAFPNSLESEIIFLLFVGFFVGIWACGKSGVEIKTPDHSGMVWDEMLAFWFISSSLVLLLGLINFLKIGNQPLVKSLGQNMFTASA